VRAKFAPTLTRVGRRKRFNICHRVQLIFWPVTIFETWGLTTVAIAPEQPVIEADPYRLIRHPSYTGFLIILPGFGLSLTNWLSLLVTMGCALLGVSYHPPVLA
jgi:protein-S-isoprenylcysteine O-methyltransferase Ste14